MSAKTDYPLTWKITKVENTKPIGIIKATLDQDFFNPHTDFIEKDESGYIVGMWADYKDTNISPIEPEEDKPIPKPYNHCVVSTSSYSLKNSGSYRTVTFTYLDENENDISSEYSSRDKEYFFEIDGEDVDKYVTYVVQDDKNIIKLKFNNSDYIGKILTVRNRIDYVFGEIQLEII